MKHQTFGFKLFLGVVVGVVVISVIAGLWTSGSPSQERARRLDERRVSDLQSISGAIDQYYNINEALPSDLNTLLNARETGYVNAITDPESGETYAYRPQSDMTYELCADFTTESQESDPRLVDPYLSGNRFWQHGPEPTCFSITVQVFPK